MPTARKSVSREATDAALNRPAPRRTVAQVEIRRRSARDSRRRTLPRGEPILESLSRQQLGQHAIRTVEFADLTERAICNEVDRVLAVSDGKVDGKAARYVGRIVCHEITATICFDGPARLECTGVAQCPEQRRPNERSVGNREPTERTDARSGGWRIAEPELLQPAVIAPHADPGRVDMDLPRSGWTQALREDFQ